MTYDKQNSLCYAAGYVPKCLRNCLKHSGHPFKRQLMWKLLDLTDENDDVIEDKTSTEEWLNRIDRGGLQT